MTADEFIALQEVTAGRFLINQEIGRGGMGIVYLARDVGLDRPVALKVLPLELATEPVVRERFLREARTAAGLSHPNIVPIHAVEDHGDIVFFVMGFVDGETLRERVDRKGALTPREGATLLQEVAWALGLAHARGIVHRDIKPDNILIERATGRAMVTDFGIARPLEASQLTGVGEVVGTVHYMSPEQVSGVAIDGRSDLYSLGITGFFALTGRLPFDGPHAPAIIAQHLTAVPVPVGSVKELPGRLATAVDRCLSKNPDDRHPDAASFADDVGASVAAVQVTPPEVRLFLRYAEAFRTQALVLAGVGVWSGIFLDSWPAFAIPMIFIFGHVGEFAVRTRRLQEDGFDRDDLVNAIKAAAQERREEMASDRPLMPLFPKGRASAVFWGIVSGMLGLGSVALFVFTLTERFFSWWRSAFVLAFALGMGAIGGVLLWTAFVPSFSERVVAWFRKQQVGTVGRTAWSGWLGRLFFALTRPKRFVLSKVSAPQAPTERLVLEAADALVEDLPAGVRARLTRVTEVIQRLEQKATALRVRRQRIEKALAEAGAPPDVAIESGDAAGLDVRRRELVDDLAQAAQLARERLSAVVTAMENVRLGLLRLRAGVATVEEITAELDRSDELNHRIEAELEMRDALE